MNATEKGRQLWDNFIFGRAQQAYKKPDETQWREAFNKAREVVRRLAPELKFDTRGRMLTNGLAAYGQGLIMNFDDSMQQAMLLCCANTFADDPWVPDMEKALTYYLYYKLFRQRFENRPVWHQAKHGQSRRHCSYFYYPGWEP